jgi:hypothetical protein
VTALCAVNTCAVHVTGCPREDCDCPPATTEPGLLVCAYHADATRERLKALPSFWAILSTKPTTGRAEVRGSAEPPEPIGEAARTARTTMRTMLATWSNTLTRDRGSPLPDEQTITAATRTQVLHHQNAALHADWDADCALHAWRRAPNEQRPALAVQRDTALRRAHQARQAATAARDTREDGSDVIEALREHIDRHLTWLLQHPTHAGQLVDDIHTAWAGARSAIPRPAAAVRILCKCGERVALNVTGEHGQEFHCACGEWGTLEWWWDQVAPPSDTKPIPLRDLPDWLLAHHRLVVTHKQLRNWRDRGHLAPHDWVQTPTRYDPVAVAIVARTRLKLSRTA